MELKTLKDLQEFGSNGIKKLHYVECDKLRAEAVKWIKALEQNDLGEYKEIDICELTSYSEYDLDRDAVINMIKHFFNLTEADLK